MPTGRRASFRFYGFRPDCRLRRVSEGRFEVVVGDDTESLEVDKKTGDLLECILPALNGDHSLEQIAVYAKAHCRSASRTRVEEIVANLFKWGLISELHPQGGYTYPMQPRYFSSFTSYPSAMQQKLGECRVGVVGGRFAAPVLIDSLRSAGVSHFRLLGEHVVEPEETPFYRTARAVGTSWSEALSEQSSEKSTEGPVTIEYDPRDPDAMLDDPGFAAGLDVVVLLLPGVEEGVVLKANRACLSGNIKLMLGSFDWAGATMGPFVIPFESSCLACAESRIREARPQDNESGCSSYHYAKSLLGRPRPVHSSVNLLPFVMGYTHLLSGYLCHHILGLSSVLINHEVRFDFMSAVLYRDFILKSPRCPACGERSWTRDQTDSRCPKK
jgi:hypothetical protein